MRALKPEEICLVAGGAGSTITVTGSRGGSTITVTGSPPGSTITVIGRRQQQTIGGSGGGGGGGGGLPTAPTYQDVNCAVNALHSQTDAKSDVDSKEHFSIVYHDATGYHTSPVFTGSSTQGVLSPLFNWMTANNVSFSQVVDLYHNHDFSEYGGDPDTAAVNRYPSAADWSSAADHFVSMGADPAVFMLTVEDTDHVARDFSYSQESTFEHLTLQQKEDGYKLPAKAPAC